MGHFFELPKGLDPDFRSPRKNPKGLVTLDSETSIIGQSIDVFMAGHKRNLNGPDVISDAVLKAGGWDTLTSGVDIGTTDYIQQGNFTIFVDFYWAGTDGAHHVLVAKRDTWAVGDMRWQLVRNSIDGGLYFQRSGDTVNLGKTGYYTAGERTQLVVTCDGTRTKTFVAGKIVANVADSLNFGTDAAAAVMIGATPSGENHNGIIYSVFFGPHISDDAARQLSKAPYYAELKPVIPLTIFAAAGGNAIPMAAHLYKQMRSCF